MCMNSTFVPSRLQLTMHILESSLSTGIDGVCLGSTQLGANPVFCAYRSTSMGNIDRKPILDHPSAVRIVPSANNRLGSVYQALYSFWGAQASRLAQLYASHFRRDAYSAILFSSKAVEAFSNDFDSSPDELLSQLLRHGTSFGSNFDDALRLTQEVMDTNWSIERSLIPK